jgi:hypothetical protein
MFRRKSLRKLARAEKSKSLYSRFPFRSVRADEAMKGTMYIVSRDGLYSIDPKGALAKVFNGVDWMDK